jgi:hypothetical protein
MGTKTWTPPWHLPVCRSESDHEHLLPWSMGKIVRCWDCPWCMPMKSKYFQSNTSYMILAPQVAGLAWGFCSKEPHLLYEVQQFFAAVLHSHLSLPHLHWCSMNHGIVSWMGFGSNPLSAFGCCHLWSLTLMDCPGLWTQGWNPGVRCPKQSWSAGGTAVVPMPLQQITMCQGMNFFHIHWHAFYDSLLIAEKSKLNLCTSIWKGQSLPRFSK